MGKLGPRLISTKPGGGGSRFRLSLILLVTFALGVFVGTKIKNIDIEITKKKEAYIDGREANIQENAKSHSREDNSTVKAADTNPAINGKDVNGPKSSGEPEPSTDKYTLQVAAFAEMERAQKLVNELKEKGYDAYIVSTRNSRGEAWNFIKVGRFKTKEEAQDFADSFQEKETLEAIVEELDQR
jgi:cell division septation protein DedD